MDAEQLARLAEKIESRITVNDSGCWVYPTKNSDDYARISVKSETTKSGYTTVRPSRVMYEVQVGPIPPGMELDHVKSRGCTSTACCNPAHLETVTGRENKLRGDTVAARNAAKTHCPQGHLYDEANTYYSPDGSRLCRACHREKKALRRWLDGAGLPSSERTHCPQNHPYDEANTKITTKGYRQCRACIEARKEQRRDRARARREELKPKELLKGIC